MELDQVQDVFSDATEEENLFADVDDTPVEPTETEVQQEETPKAFLKVNYMGEEKDLNEDETRTYAQKGMDYDRIHEVYKPIEQLARKNNMSVEEYVNQLNTTQREYELSMEMDRLRQDPKYENVSDEVLEELAKSRITENAEIQNKKIEEEQKAQADAREEMIRRDVETFVKEYPQFAGEGQKNLDDKVFDYVRQGYTLLEAYEKYQRESSQAKISRQNEENKKRSLGNTTNAGKVETDDFLSGFLNG